MNNGQAWIQFLLRSPAPAMGVASLCAAAAAPCAGRYLALAKVEALLADGACGMAPGQGFTLGCSHCWAAAAAMLLGVSFALIWTAMRRAAPAFAKA